MDCPTGASCDENGGSTQELLTVKPGYWRVAALSVDVLECPVKRICVGGRNFTDNGDGYCAEGQMGPLCTQCDPAGFYFNPDKQYCIKCEKINNDPVQLWLESPTLILATLVVIVLVVVFVSIAVNGISSASLDTSSVRMLKLIKIRFKAFTSFSQIAANVSFNCRCTSALATLQHTSLRTSASCRRSVHASFTPPHHHLAPP